MALFSSWFKAKPGATEDGDAPSPDAHESAPAETPAMPTPSVRKVNVTSVQPGSVSEASPRRPIALTSSTMPPMPGGGTPSVARKISFGLPDSSPQEEESPVVPLHGEAPPAPAGPDMAVHLELGDFIDRIPTNLLKPGGADRHKQLEFHSSELYSDLSRGRATVPASVIYNKCPEIFARPISETEDVEVHLPLHRLVEQMGAALSPRQDQTPEESVTEIETPFLQVALEDNARLAKAPGTSVGATVRALGPTARRPAAPAMPSIPPPKVAKADPDPRGVRRTGQVSPISPLKQPIETRSLAAPAAPTAQSAGPIIASKRPPSTVRASVAGGKIRLSAPTVNTRNIKPATTTPAVPPDAAPGAPRVYSPAAPRVASVSPSHQVTKKTARIQIPPISLRPAAAGSPRPPAAPATPSVPPAFPRRGPEPLTSFKPAGGAGSPSVEPPTFRSTPPPPTSIKPLPPSFSPARPSVAAPVVPPTTPPEDGAASGLTQESHAEPAVVSSQTIEISLAAVLRGLPSTALVVEPSSMPDSARISLPFSLIEPQLANGRVNIALEAFRNSLPSAFNHVLTDDCDLTEVPIPLQEIFQNLPANAISQRDDQIIEEARNAFPTPFSQKAEEDAKRFGTPPPAMAVEPAAKKPAPPATEPAVVVDEPLADRAEVSESVVEQKAFPAPEQTVGATEEPGKSFEAPAVDPQPVEQADDVAAPEKQEEPLKVSDDPLSEEVLLVVAPDNAAAPALAPAAGSLPTLVRPADSTLQTLFMTEEELDAKTVAKLASRLPGVESCSVMFGDGLLLASSLPQDGHTEGFSAMAPALFQKVLNFTTELSLGELHGCTLYTDQGLLTLFTHANICVSVRHVGRGFLPGVREKLLVVTRELAGMYGPAQADLSTAPASQ